ncbi:TRAM domain-containing protein [Candidatus Woesearchaeota archaeon]|nr:TRAM domain-containing protein [Candidatus Woesearchaeota archaeon]
MRQRFQENVAPVKQGDELQVTIEGVGEKGDGIAKVKGFVLFVPNTKQGDQVMVRVNRVLAKVGFAEVIGQAKQEQQQEQPKKEEGAPEESYEGYEDTEDFGEEE